MEAEARGRRWWATGDLGCYVETYERADLLHISPRSPLLREKMEDVSKVQTQQLVKTH